MSTKRRVPAPAQDRHPRNQHLGKSKSSSGFVALTWLYKDAAREQARRGAITWAEFREFCAEVNRIKRARLSAARERASRASQAVIAEVNE